MPLKNSVTCLDLHKQHGYLRNIFFIKKTVTVHGKQMQPYKGSELTSTSYNASLLIIEAVT